jgi:membrane protease YdiL (CAAX protease family)
MYTTPQPDPAFALVARVAAAGALLAGLVAFLWVLGVAAPGLSARLRDGARRLRGRGLDATCAWACLLLILALAIPAAWAAWLPPAPAPAPTPLMLLVQPLALYVCMLAVAAACAWRGHGPVATFGLSRADWRDAVRDGLVYGLALVPVVLILSLGAQSAWRWMGLEPTPQDAFGWLADGDYPLWSRLGLAAVAAIVAPVAEEAVFRGVLLAALVPRARLAVALLLQGALFGVAHGHGPSFVPLLVAGIGFGAGYAANGSLITPVVMHAVFNIASLSFFLACGQA